MHFRHMKKLDKYDLWMKMFALQNEAQKRRLAATLALELGWGGITMVENLTGTSHTTIRKGIREIQDEEKLTQQERIRKPGGGRKKIDFKDPKINEDLEALMDENTAGDPMSPLKWTNKSTYAIADELNARGHKVSPDSVGRLLKKRGYSLQANVKTIEGNSSVERDEQFKYMNEQVRKFIEQRYPVISVDTKKRETVGNFKNHGRTWEKKGQPKLVNVYDFLSLGSGIAIPYGIYDVFKNKGFVNVGISNDTSEFAVETIRQWWNLMGRCQYHNAKNLLICADGGGSNGSRRKGWKYFLQEFADEIKIPITICHLPPGTSKWNKIEHRMFSFISMNWKGKPLINYETVINLIGSTKTKKGLTIVAQLDEREYEKGRKFTKEDMGKIRLKTHILHPKWNYSIFPKSD